MYTAVIDPTNGYAYFFGSYLTKVDITGSLPVQIGTNILTGQFAEGAIDTVAGYAYMPKPNQAGGVIYRYALGEGTNSVSAAGSLTLPQPAWPGMSIVIDNSDPNPTNHFAYVMCSGNGSAAQVVKVQLSTFTNVSATTLTNSGSAFAWGQIDTKKGYAYFGSYTIYTAPFIPQVMEPQIFLRPFLK